MPTCAMPGCFHRPDKDRARGVTFHYVPKNEDRRAKWTQHAGKSLTCRDVICSVHFSADSFIPHGKRIGLTADAIPCLHETGDPHDRIKRIKLDHSYHLPSAPLLKSRLNAVCDRAQSLQKAVNNKSREIKRLKRQVSSLQDVIQELEDKGMVSEKASEFLSSFDSLPQQVIQRMKRNQNRENATTAEYPAELKAFAFTLHFYSAKAYRYVRDNFDLALPHEKTVSSWYSSIDSQPGFCKEAFGLLEARQRQKREQGGNLFVSVMCDEMHIATRQEWDPSIQGFRGYIDMGPCGPNDSSVLANSCLVFMAVCVNEGWKIPLAYFFVRGLGGKERANLSRIALSKIEEVGIIPVCLVCDGPHSNQTMLRDLGAVLDPQNLQPYFITDSGLKVYVMLDICHMLKLARNFFEREGCFLDDQGRTISWQYVIDLVELQKLEGLRCANKLSQRHVDFHHQKMRVSLGAQLLSASVASAIEFCDHELGLPKFKNSDGTVKFLRTMDRLFDLLNSRNPWAKNFKAAMRMSNKPVWQPFLDNAEAYIRGLKTLSGKPVLETQGKTAFLGFLLGMSSVEGIFRDFVMTKKLSYLLTYKFSQDHLELFFSSVRSGLGHNDNPSCREFVSLFKKLLVRHEVKAVNGNAIPLDETVLLHVTSKRKPTIEIDAQDIGLLKTLGDNPTRSAAVGDLLPLPTSTLYKNCVTSYIAGYVVKMICRFLKCPECLDALTSTDPGTSLELSLIRFKDNGGLVYPSQSVIHICKVVEKQFSLLGRKEQTGQRNYLEKYVRMPAIMELLQSGHWTFKELDNHEVDAAPLMGHKVRLVKSVIDAYCKIRIHHVAKMASLEKDSSVRKKLTKLIHFKND